MLTADTSVVVPSLLEWHDHHEIARPAVAEVRRLPAHVLAEAFSVLTRLPHGLSLPAEMAATVLLEAFPDEPLDLDGPAHRDLLVRLGSAGIRGGAVYDAVVGASAARADAELVTLDGRAAGVYRAVGVRYRVPEQIS